ncbi:MAG: DUF2155 domain-containing protein [Acidisphaera sp.]|nr:DUF2155 domain-containing protein [Acidisphaera sp.]
MTRRAAAALGLLALATVHAAAQAQAPAPPAQPAPAPAAPPAANWLTRTSIELKVLDKVRARSASLSGQVGETLHFGTLNIAVTSCVVHPPDQPADAAAYLAITDTRAGAPGFRGWMFAAEPSLNMFESPVYDVRVTGCGA